MFSSDVERFRTLASPSIDVLERTGRERIHPQLPICFYNLCLVFGVYLGYIELFAG